MLPILEETMSLDGVRQSVNPTYERIEVIIMNPDLVPSLLS